MRNSFLVEQQIMSTIPQSPSSYINLCIITLCLACWWHFWFKMESNSSSYQTVGTEPHSVQIILHTRWLSSHYMLRWNSCLYWLIDSGSFTQLINHTYVWTCPWSDSSCVSSRITLASVQTYSADNRTIGKHVATHCGSGLLPSENLLFLFTYQAHSKAYISCNFYKWVIRDIYVAYYPHW